MRRQVAENTETEGMNPREKMWQLRENICQSTGTKIWDGLDESHASLPLVGVSHKGNRRNLVSHPPNNIFFPEENGLYGIGSWQKSQAKKMPLKKMSKKMEGGKGPPSRPVPRPHPGPTPRPNRPTPRPNIPPYSGPGPGPKPTPSPTTGCKTEFTVNFLQLSAIPPALFVDPTNPNEQTLGTRYVYNDGLRDKNTLDELTNSKASGICTRTQARVGSPTVGLQLGGGYCQFTYVLKDSQNRSITFTATGEVSDSVGGVLSITGGSQSALGAFGEIELLPVNLAANGQFNTVTGDFFLDPLFYLADAKVSVPCS